MKKQYIVFPFKKQLKVLKNIGQEMPKTFQKILRSISISHNHDSIIKSQRR